MSFDGIVTRAVVHECNATLIGGRITKIYQPTEREILLHIRSQGHNHILFLSIHPTYASFYVTEHRRENPTHPPMFCMLLRKHMENAVIESIIQVGLERIVHLNYRSRNELGDIVTHRLVIEVMGRHSNLILMDPKTNTIFDSIKRVPASVSKHRIVLPGATYKEPPEQGKSNPLDVTEKKFIAGFDYNAGQMEKQIVSRFSGISPQIAREIVSNAEIGSREKLWISFHDLQDRIKTHRYEPSIGLNKGKKWFSPFPLTYMENEITVFSSMSACLDSFYHKKVEQDQLFQQAQDLIKRLKNEISKNEKKIDVLTKELAHVEEADQYRIFGELITAYMHQIKRGDEFIQTVNFHDPEAKEVQIPLDSLLSPSQNAQRYFKKYQKIKASKKWNEEQIQKALEENHYLESVLVQLEQSSIAELAQIREELQEQGWIKEKGKKGKRKKEVPALPTAVFSSEGIKILIGKNNKQNEQLTHRVASSSDTWLHAKDIPGSHVVIKGQNFGNNTLLEAAMLAAYFSKARYSAQVPVDYTFVKNVKKPSGSRPGFVIYDHQQTAYVTPDEEKVERLLRQTNSVQKK